MADNGGEKFYRSGFSRNAAAPAALPLRKGDRHEQGTADRRPAQRERLGQYQADRPALEGPAGKRPAPPQDRQARPRALEGQRHALRSFTSPEGRGRIARRCGAWSEGMRVRGYGLTRDLYPSPVSELAVRADLSLR